MFITIRVHTLKGDDKKFTSEVLGNVVISTSGDNEIFIEWNEKTIVMSIDEAKKIAKIITGLC